MVGKGFEKFLEVQSKKCHIDQTNTFLECPRRWIQTDLVRQTTRCHDMDTDESDRMNQQKKEKKK